MCGLGVSHERQGQCSTSGREADTWIIPMVQLGSAGLRQVHAHYRAPVSSNKCMPCKSMRLSSRSCGLSCLGHLIKFVQMSACSCCAQDEALTTLFLRAAEPGSTLAISTAYLNLARSFEAALAAKPTVNLLLKCTNSATDKIECRWSALPLAALHADLARGRGHMRRRSDYLCELCLVRLMCGC